MQKARDHGLSPRVRGSHTTFQASGHTDGSIPASAGQPRARARTPSKPTVYPRECGAALIVVCVIVDTSGLSPRVRGSPSKMPFPVCCLWSIPASAGQPLPRRAGRGRARVYPRECGAAFTSKCVCVICLGLSPRVRGSP